MNFDKTRCTKKVKHFFSYISLKQHINNYEKWLKNPIPDKNVSNTDYAYTNDIYIEQRLLHLSNSNSYVKYVRTYEKCRAYLYTIMAARSHERIFGVNRRTEVSSK